MKKRSVIMLLSLALLGAFSVNAAAEEETGEMTEAAAETEAQEEVSMVQGSYSVKSEEATVSYGEKEVYGVLYRPEEDGVYPTVILSHGYNGTNQDFVNECEYFASNGIVAYAYDFCGGSVNSKSSGDSTDMTIFTEKEDLLAVLDYIEGQEMVDKDHIFLFGGSQGGLVTALAGAERVDEVEGLIMYFPGFCIPDDWRNNYATVEEIPETVDFWGLNLGENFFLSMRDFDPYEVIPAFDKDVLIVHGDEDPIVPISYSVKAQETYEHTELVVFPDEGHGFSATRGVEAAELALRFMQRKCQ